MSIYALVEKWIREAQIEYLRAKEETNLLKMRQIQNLIQELNKIKDNF